MSGVRRFLNRLDATAWRAVSVSIALFAGVMTILVLGKTGVFGTFAGYEESFTALKRSPWGLPAVIAAFCLGAFLGAPQFGLIAAAVVAFGPWTGFAYSWIATLVSGAATFWTGRIAGEAAFRRYAGEGANRISAFIGRNAFLASALVRNAPTAPFIVVNMAFGVSHARFLHFFAGMALGIIPKTALVAFAGQSVVAALSGAPLLAAAAAIAAIGGWLALMLFARKRIRAQGQSVPLRLESDVDLVRDPAE